MGLLFPAPTTLQALGRRAALARSTSTAGPGGGQHQLASLSLLDIIFQTGAASAVTDDSTVTPMHLLDAVASRMDAYKASHALEEETLVAARDQAGAGEATRLWGRARSMLDGIPLALKGNWALKGTPLNTQRTGLLRGHTSPASATLVERLSQAGSPFSGKTAVNEFGIGAVDMTVQPDSVLSPWYSTDEGSKEARFVGGRSGGPATAVATGMAFGAVSADLAGTLRVPAAYSGTVGLMASRDRLPRHGLLSIAPGLETPGVVARTVADAALLLAFLQGQDGCEHLAKLLDIAADKPQDVDAALPAIMGLPEGDAPLRGLRVGRVDAGGQGFSISDAQQEALDQGVEYLVMSGASAHSHELPDLREGVAAFYHSTTGQVLGDKKGLGSMLAGLGFDQADTSAEVTEEVCSILEATRKRGLQAAGHSGMSCRDAARISDSFTDGMRMLLSGQVDILLLPSAPGAAPTVAEASQWGDEQLLALDALNVPATLAGMPAVTVPVALTSKEGLPVGLQLVAAPMAEARLLAAAHVVEHHAQRHSCAAGDLLVPLHAPDEGKAPINTV